MDAIKLLKEYIKLLEVNAMCARDYFMHELDPNTKYHYLRSRERLSIFRNDNPQFRDHRGYRLDEEIN